MAAAAGDWTVVRRRGRRRGDATGDAASQPDAPPPLPVTPIAWSPSDPSLDAARVSRLVDRARAAISRVAASRLYGRLLLPGSPLRRRLALLAPTRLSLLGVGSFENSPSSRLQLALAALLRRDLLLPESSTHADLFDPVLSAAECAAAAALGFTMPEVNDGCRRRADEPTLFYMPHCEASLYDALLAANWEPPSQLRRVCMLGNSFRNYAVQAEENRSGPAAKAKHVLAAERFAWEERVNEKGGVDDDDDDVFARAFNETSWHFFEVDDAVDLAAAVFTGGGRMPRRGKATNSSYCPKTGNAFNPLPLSSGVPVPMCWCGDPCKVAKSDEEETYMQRYWMCANFEFEPTPEIRRINLMTPPPLCDFEQWIDTEIKPQNKERLEYMRQWDAERKEKIEQRRKEGAAEKEHKAEAKRRRVAAYREERERKLERARRAKAAMEENPDAQRKGKWPRCTQ